MMETMTIQEYNRGDVNEQLYKHHKVLMFQRDGSYYFVADTQVNLQGTYDVFVMDLLGHLTGEVIIVPAETEYEVAETQLFYQPRYILTHNGNFILGTMLLEDAKLSVYGEWRESKFQVTMRLSPGIILTATEVSILNRHMRIAEDYMRSWQKATVKLIRS